MAYPGVWRKPGTTVPTYALSSLVRSCTGSRFSWSRRIPAGWSRRHSMYIESADLDAAIRSGMARCARQTRHQVRMSSSLGAFLADSIRLVLASCQPAAADRARAVRRASRRMSRSRSASCSRARWTLDDGEMGMTGGQAGPVLAMRNRPAPDLLECFGARPDHLAILAQIMPQERPVAGEEPEAHEPVIEQPEVGQRYQQARRGVPGQPPDLLARRDIERRRLVLEADVVGKRLADDPRPAELNATRRMLANQVIPGGTSRGSGRLSRPPAGEGRVIGRVGVPGLQVGR